MFARHLLDESNVQYVPREIDWFLMQATACSALDLVTEPDREVSVQSAATFRGFVHRRCRHEPVQYILQSTEFYGLTFRVNPSVLIPRPETEGLVDRALDIVHKQPGTSVLDIGTGSGCISIAVAVNAPGTRVVAVDVSIEALDVARWNGLEHSVDITWIQADFNRIESFKDVQGPFELIVSNPPYVSGEELDKLEPEVREYEPHLALNPGSDPERPYRQLGVLAACLLSQGGCLIAEINENQGDMVKRLLADSGISDVEIQPDLSGRDRYVLART